MREIKIRTLDVMRRELYTWCNSISDDIVFGIAEYTDEQQQVVALGFYVERTSVDPSDPTPFIRRHCSALQVKEYFDSVTELFEKPFIPCTMCFYTDLGLTIRSAVVERARVRKEKEFQKEQMQAKAAKHITAKKPKKKQKKKTNTAEQYQKEFRKAKEEIRANKLNLLQAIGRLPVRSTGDGGKRVRYDWDNIEADYEHLDRSITAVANKMGCTTAAVRRQLKNRKIGPYRNRSKKINNG